MKVILNQDIPKVGKKYEVKNVADGHALNFLIPRGLAVAATAGALKKLAIAKTQLVVEKKVQIVCVFSCTLAALIVSVQNQCVLGQARRAVRLEPVQREQLARLDEAFLTSVSRGVLAVASIDGRPVGAGRPGPVALALAERLQATVEREARRLQLM